MRIAPAATALLIACSAPSDEVNEYALAPVPLAEAAETSGAAASESPGATGILRVPANARGTAQLSVSVVGLDAERAYVLCLNTAEPGSRTSEELAGLQVPGWPVGETYLHPAGYTQGHWNFATLETDAEGRLEQSFELPLPSLDYRVRFLVKTAYREGSIPVLQSDPVLIAVAPERRELWAAGAVVLLLSTIGGLWMRRRRARAGSAELEGPGADASAPSTLVGRRRRDGALRHGPTYGWIEINGRRKTFRPRQALVFQILCEQDPNCDGLPQKTIIEQWEKSFGAKRANPVRVRDIFRACSGEPGDFIVRVPGPASVYRLRLDAESRSPGSAAVRSSSSPAPVRSRRSHDRVPRTAVRSLPDALN